MAEPEIPLEITAEELVPRISGESREFTLLDVRERYELDRGVLRGAVHLAMSEIEARRDELEREREIVVYCEHGVRSYNVAAWLQSHGYRATSLAGGFAEWPGERVPLQE